jgi:hypothetical protein
MKNIILTIACLITLTTHAQTKIAEISTPGRWLVYETGHVFQIDSLDSAVSLLTKAGEENCSAWIIQVDKDMLCSVWITATGVQFRQSAIDRNETAFDNRKKIKLHGSNK